MLCQSNEFAVLIERDIALYTTSLLAGEILSGFVGLLGRETRHGPDFSRSGSNVFDLTTQQPHLDRQTFAWIVDVDDVDPRDRGEQSQTHRVVGENIKNRSLMRSVLIFCIL